MTQAGKGQTIHPSQEELAALEKTYPEVVFIKTGQPSQGLYTIRIGTPADVRGASSSGPSSRGSSMSSASPGGGPTITLGRVSELPGIGSHAGSATMQAEKMPLETSGVSPSSPGPETVKEMQRIVLKANIVQKDEWIPSELIGLLQEKYEGIQIDVREQDQYRGLSKIRITNPPPTDLSMAEIAAEMVEIDKVSDTPGEWKTYFVGSEEFIDRLKKADPKIKIEIHRFSTAFFRTDGLKFFSIPNSLSLAEPPERTERVRQIIAQIKRNPGTTFYETEEVYNALRREFGSTHVGAFPNLHSTSRIVQFSGRYARLDKLPDPPPSSAPAGPESSQQDPSQKEDESFRQKLATMRETTWKSQTPQRFDVSLHELQKLGEVWPPVKFELISRKPSDEYTIEIAVPKFEGFSRSGVDVESNPFPRHNLSRWENLKASLVSLQRRGASLVPNSLAHPGRGPSGGTSPPAPPRRSVPDHSSLRSPLLQESFVSSDQHFDSSVGEGSGTAARPPSSQYVPPTLPLGAPTPPPGGPKPSSPSRDLGETFEIPMNSETGQKFKVGDTCNVEENVWVRVTGPNTGVRLPPEELAAFLAKKPSQYEQL